MIYAIILGGGRGERFWPRSTQSSPKQLLPLITEKPMIVETIQRILPLVPQEKIIIVTPKELESSFATLLPDFKLLLEPFGRNTAPAIGYAAISIEDPDSVMIVLPADHFIPDEKKFISSMEKGIQIAEKGYLVTFGIVPTAPETGYGYIEAGENIENQTYKVKSFKEKPNQKQAQSFIKKRNFFWNSGMFVWKVSSILEAIEKYMPDVYKNLLSFKKGEKTLEDIYYDFPNISIDYGVMEKADNVVVVRAEFPWDDVGSWSALERIKNKDDKGNVLCGNCVGIDTCGSIIFSDEGVIGTVGIKDCVIVKSGSSVLVCDKNRTQEVKTLIQKIKERKELEKYL